MKKAKIYALKNGNDTVYIGKTIKENKEGKIPISRLGTVYANPQLNKIVVNNDNANIDILEEVPVDNWFDPKLNKIVEIHKTGANLRNAEHFLKGYRGYWQNKKRDAYTLSQLSKSKHKRILQYDMNGSLIKIWDSIKDAAEEVIGDYEIINGSAKSSLYKITRSKYITSRLYKKYYWIREDEFEVIPKKINVDAILEHQKKVAKEKRKKYGKPMPPRNLKKINVFDRKTNKFIRTYNSVVECSAHMDIPIYRISNEIRYLRIYNDKYRFEHDSRALIEKYKKKSNFGFDESNIPYKIKSVNSKFKLLSKYVKKPLKDEEGVYILNKDLLKKLKKVDLNTSFVELGKLMSKRGIGYKRKGMKRLIAYRISAKSRILEL